MANIHSMNLQAGDKIVYPGISEYTKMANGDIVATTGQTLASRYQHPDSDCHLFKLVSRAKATSTHTLTPGGTYTSANGDGWECIAVKGDAAWLAGIHGDEYGAAYRFNLDGTPVCLETASDKYRIVFEPVRTYHSQDITLDGENAVLTYEREEGKFKPETVRVAFEVNT